MAKAISRRLTLFVISMCFSKYPFVLMQCLKAKAHRDLSCMHKNLHVANHLDISVGYMTVSFEANVSK